MWRLDLVETLRVAAPWQRLRRQTQPQRSGVIVHKDDFRVRRFKEHRETTAIFVVDASGSSAIKRLAEAKGAVEGKTLRPPAHRLCDDPPQAVQAGLSIAGRCGHRNHL